jgi:hypothetical protein
MLRAVRPPERGAGIECAHAILAARPPRENESVSKTPPDRGLRPSCPVGTNECGRCEGVIPASVRIRSLRADEPPPPGPLGGTWRGRHRYYVWRLSPTSPQPRRRPRASLPMPIAKAAGRRRCRLPRTACQSVCSWESMRSMSAGRKPISATSVRAVSTNSSASSHRPDGLPGWGPGYRVRRSVRRLATTLATGRMRSS